jgi:hypothetical protein
MLYRAMELSILGSIRGVILFLEISAKPLWKIQDNFTSKQNTRESNLASLVVFLKIEKCEKVRRLASWRYECSMPDPAQLDF